MATIPIPDGRGNHNHNNNGVSVVKWLPIIVVWVIQFAGLIWSAATLASKVDNLNTAVGKVDIRTEVLQGDVNNKMTDIFVRMGKIEVRVDNLDVRRR